jgi:hypothetical protein
MRHFKSKILLKTKTKMLIKLQTSTIYQIETYYKQNKSEMEYFSNV